MGKCRNANIFWNSMRIADTLLLFEICSLLKHLGLLPLFFFPAANMIHLAFSWS